MSALVDRITSVLRQDGWTCEYHEPVSGPGECSQCDDAHRRTAERVAEAAQADIDLLRWLLAESLWHEQIRRDQVQALRRALPISIPEPNPYMSANYDNQPEEKS